MGVLSQNKINEHLDFYNWQVLERQVRHSTASQHIQELIILNNYRGSRPLTYELIVEFMTFKRQTCKNSYINHYINFAAVWCDYQKYLGQPADARYKTIKYFKIEDTNKSTMSDDEIEKFLALPPKSAMRLNGRTKKPMLVIYNQNGMYAKWTLFFSVLAFTGMRPNEVATLTAQNVDFGRNVFVVTSQNSKTHDQRFVPIASNLLEPLKKHMENCGEYLFKSVHGSIFNSVDWCYNFQDRVKRLDIKRAGLTCYSLRHSFITRMLDEDVNLFKVQKIVGHKRVDTTAKYEHLTTKDIQKAILRHPLIRKNTDPQVVVDALFEYVRGLGCEIIDFANKDGEVTLKMKMQG